MKLFNSGLWSGNEAREISTSKSTRTTNGTSSPVMVRKVHAVHLDDAGTDVVVLDQLADVHGTQELRGVVVDVSDDDEQRAARRHLRLTAVLTDDAQIVRVTVLAVQRRQRRQSELAVVQSPQLKHALTGSVPNLQATVPNVTSPK